MSTVRKGKTTQLTGVSSTKFLPLSRTPPMMDRKSQSRYKPEWNNAVSPYLMVGSIEEEVDFLKNVFDAEVLELNKRPDGSVFHGEVRIDDSVVMIGQTRKDWPATRAHVHVYVRDVDQVYKRAVTNGAGNLKQPEDMSYGNREGGFTDPSGNQWWIAQLMIEMPEKGMAKN